MDDENIDPSGPEKEENETIADVDGEASEHVEAEENSLFFLDGEDIPAGDHEEAVAAELANEDEVVKAAEVADAAEAADAAEVANTAELANAAEVSTNAAEVADGGSLADEPSASFDQERAEGEDDVEEREQPEREDATDGPSEDEQQPEGGAELPVADDPMRVEVTVVDLKQEVEAKPEPETPLQPKKTESAESRTSSIGKVSAKKSIASASSKDVFREHRYFAELPVTSHMPSNVPRPGGPSIPQAAQWVYKPAAPVIQDPYFPVPTSCSRRPAPGPSFAGPDKCRWRRKRIYQHNILLQRRRATYDYDHLLQKLSGEKEWPANPTATVPMRPLPLKRMTWLPKQPRVQEWKIKEDAIMEKRDCNMAIKLGYETLIGNLVHIEIPGAKYLNRSWNNFLKKDLMTWGFPYERGSIQRPGSPPPPPYLVHQLKEKMWKYPKARTFKSNMNTGTNA